MYFRVYFMFRGKEHTVDAPAPVDYLKGGFWVDKNLKWGVAARSHFFIPPSQILLIEKLKEVMFHDDVQNSPLLSPPR